MWIGVPMKKSLIRATFAVVVIGCLAYLAMVYSKAERYSLYNDVRDAENHLESVIQAEKDCYRQFGHYVSTETDECDELKRQVRAGEQAGFSFQIAAQETKYSVRLVPRSETRLISLFSDESGIVRLGTRNTPATVESAPLHQR
jgi:hypothetical protein